MLSNDVLNNILITANNKGYIDLMKLLLNDDNILINFDDWQVLMSICGYTIFMMLIMNIVFDK